jgi:hypothetical protein
VNASREQQTTPMPWRERIEGLKSLLLMVWWLSIWITIAPWFSTVTGESVRLLILLLSFPLALAVLFGTQVLLFGSETAKFPFALETGAVATIVFLLTAPSGFKLAVSNFEAKSSWLVTTAIGTAMGVTYLAASVFRWFGRGRPPNTSLERTRER